VKYKKHFDAFKAIYMLFLKRDNVCVLNSALCDEVEVLDTC